MLIHCCLSFAIRCSFFTSNSKHNKPASNVMRCFSFRVLVTDNVFRVFLTTISIYYSSSRIDPISSKRYKYKYKWNEIGNNYKILHWVLLVNHSFEKRNGIYIIITKDGVAETGDEKLRQKTNGKRKRRRKKYGINHSTFLFACLMQAISLLYNLWCTKQLVLAAYHFIRIIFDFGMDRFSIET